jgi:hypothetical protein
VCLLAWGLERVSFGVFFAKEFSTLFAARDPQQAMRAIFFTVLQFEPTGLLCGLHLTERLLQIALI